MGSYPSLGWVVHEFVRVTAQLIFEYWWVGLVILAAAIYAEHKQ